MRLVPIVVAYSTLPLIFRGLMFRSSSPENIPLRADLEELSKGTYPGLEGGTFDDFLLPSFKLFKLGITAYVTSMCLN